MATTTVRPLGDRVLVKKIAQARVTAGGVHLPETAREQSDRGYVLAVGPGTPLDAVVGIDDNPARPVPVSVGEVIVFSPYAGSTVVVGNDNFLLLREHDVLGVLEGIEVVQEGNEYRIKQDEIVVDYATS